MGAPLRQFSTNFVRHRLLQHLVNMGQMGPCLLSDPESRGRFVLRNAGWYSFDILERFHNLAQSAENCG